MGWRPACAREQGQTGRASGGAKASWCLQSAPKWPGWCRALSDLGQVPGLCTSIFLPRQKYTSFPPHPSSRILTASLNPSLNMQNRAGDWRLSLEGRIDWRQPKSLVFPSLPSPLLHVWWSSDNSGQRETGQAFLPGHLVRRMQSVKR